MFLAESTSSKGKWRSSNRCQALSLSEYLGFNAAYCIAAIATIGLIAWFIGSLLRSTRMSIFITLLLIVQYGFVFTLIQLQDYALLMGAIALFILLGVVMYVTRKIDWYARDSGA